VQFDVGGQNRCQVIGQLSLPHILLFAWFDSRLALLALLYGIARAGRHCSIDI
jgi:hypothetical protein